MSDRLVQFQEWLGQYPTWVVAGGIGFVVVVVVILLWKAMRIALTALIVAVLVAGGWYVWEKFVRRDQPTVRPTAVPAPETPAAPQP